jgi:hypothetical protein
VLIDEITVFVVCAQHLEYLTDSFLTSMKSDSISIQHTHPIKYLLYILCWYKNYVHCEFSSQNHPPDSSSRNYIAISIGFRHTHVNKAKWTYNIQYANTCRVYIVRTHTCVT